MRVLPLFLLLLGLVPVSLLFADEEPEPPATLVDRLVGVWKGPCTVRRPKGPDLDFPMELHVAPIEGRDAWTWKIIYGEGEKRQVRPYELLPVDVESGHYRVDEKNSIEIDAWAVDDALHSRFQVGQSQIDVTYTLRGDALEVTLVTYDPMPLRMTGGEGRVPRVASHGLRAVQKGVLRR